MEGFTVDNWMSKDVLTASGDESILDAAKRMSARNVGSIVIVQDGKPVGIFTERDALKKVVVPEKDYQQTMIKDVMSTNLITVNFKEEYGAACEIIRDINIRHIPVVDDEGFLVGIISIKDLSGYFKKG